LTPLLLFNNQDKIIQRWFMKILLVLSTLFLSSQLYAQAFTLNCLGGGEMKLDLRVNDSGTAWYNLNFTKAPAGTNTRLLLPGECAWAHRGLSNNEPASIAPEFGFKAQLEVFVKAGTVPSFRFGARQSDTNAIKRIREIYRIRAAIASGQTFSIIAPYNSRERKLYVDRILGL
jgi:hypothetical protein